MLQTLVINYWHGTYSYVTLHLIIIAHVVEYTILMVPLVLLMKRSGKWGFLTVPALWVFFEYLRSSGILGYPWGILGTSQYRFLQLIQIASITGVWGGEFHRVSRQRRYRVVLGSPRVSLDVVFKQEFRRRTANSEASNLAVDDGSRKGSYHGTLD